MRVVVEGELDLGAAPHWDDTVLPLLEPPCPTHVEVELGGVEFLDSSGLGLLVTLRHWSESNAIPLRLVNVPHGVMRVFDYSGVTPLFVMSAAQLEPD
jgi:anti-sigma B factor antagonist